MARDTWGWHLTLDISSANEKVKDPEFLKEWVKQLVKDISMVAYGEPQVIHFGEGEAHLSGWTVQQFIETSNITCHFCDEHQDGYIDVFSCKEFDPEIVIKNINDNFGPKEIEKRLFTRGVNR
jgi:S-adenosylmethionine/arginine decarboxylase-like enzyme